MPALHLRSQFAPSPLPASELTPTLENPDTVDEEVVEILYLGGSTEEERSSHKQQLAFVEQPERDETSVRHDYPPSLQYLVAETKSCRGADIRKVIRTEFLGL
jgi:hypothetical protein